MLGRAEGWLRLVVLKDVRVSRGDAQDESMSLSALAELSRGSKELEISDCRGGESPNYIRVDAGTVRCVLCIAVVVRCACVGIIVMMIVESSCGRVRIISIRVRQCSVLCVCCIASVEAYGPNSDIGVFARIEFSNRLHQMYSDSLYSSLLRQRSLVGEYDSTFQARVCRSDRARCVCAPGSASVHLVSLWDSPS